MHYDSLWVCVITVAVWRHQKAEETVPTFECKKGLRLLDTASNERLITIKRYSSFQTPVVSFLFFYQLMAYNPNYIRSRRRSEGAYHKT
jgi:hypothetical protein